MNTARYNCKVLAASEGERVISPYSEALWTDVIKLMLNTKDVYREKALTIKLQLVLPNQKC